MIGPIVCGEALFDFRYRQLALLHRLSITRFCFDEAQTLQGSQMRLERNRPLTVQDGGIEIELVAVDVDERMRKAAVQIGRAIRGRVREQIVDIHGNIVMQRSEWNRRTEFAWIFDSAFRDIDQQRERFAFRLATLINSELHEYH